MVQVPLVQHRPLNRRHLAGYFPISVRHNHSLSKLEAFLAVPARRHKQAVVSLGTLVKTQTHLNHSPVACFLMLETRNLSKLRLETILKHRKRDPAFSQT